MDVRHWVILLTLYCFWAIAAQAQTSLLSRDRQGAGSSHVTKKQKIWRISATVLGAITIADVQSSYGRREANPFLQSSNGRFGSRGIALKSAVVGGAIAAQWLMLNKHPDAAGYAAAANFAASAATGAIVARNHMK